MILSKKRTLSRRFAINLKNVRADVFQDYPDAMQFNLVQLCPSMLLFPFAVLRLLFNRFKWLLQCFNLIFGHFVCLEITSFCRDEAIAQW